MKKHLLHYFRAILIVVLLIGACTTVTTLGLDAMCYNDLSQRLPIYPGARITLERYSFLRRYGMGETLIILDSDDPEATVRDWYGREQGRVAQRIRQDGNLRLFYGFSNATASVTTAEDGTGSQIILSGTCAAG